MTSTTTSTMPARFCTDDKGTFGQYTASVRWPIIIQNAIDDISNEIATLGGNSTAISQGEIIKKALIDFRQEVIDRIELRNFTAEEMKIAQIPGSFNEYLDKQSPRFTWAKAEWLFAEVYLYRRVNVLFRQQSQWIKFDIFNALKQSTFKASYHGVVELAIRYKNIIPQLKNLDKSKKDDKDILQVLFKEFIEISLWGNATDLSLLTNATLEDIKSIQGAKAREASESKILVNGTNEAFETLLNAVGKDDENVRIDFVLDNSGFELYADLMLAAFLLQTGLADKCIFHAKDMPYMVSDVMLKDFDILIEDLKDRTFFPSGDSTTLESQSLDLFASDITLLNKTGKLTFDADSFWTTDLDYWNIDPSETKYHGAQIHKELLNSNLVIFKGDLNYRKLTGDRTWKRTTAWSTAIGPLATNGLTTLSLRTCKADVQVDLQPGQDEALSAAWEKDHPGQGSWWCSSGKWAVICFSKGR